MTVVVTGSGGLVGSNLVRELLAQGRSVRVLVHQDQRAIEGLDVEVVRGDVRDLDSLVRAFDSAEVVYHLAAYISLQMDESPLVEAVNVTGTRNVVEACLKCDVRRLIHFSSVEAFAQEPKDVPLNESRPLLESGDYPPYYLSKAAGEKEVLRGIEKGLDAVILNPTGIMGPFDFKPSLLGESFINLSRRKIPALVEGGFDWVDVRDVVTGAITAEESAPTGAKYLLSGHWLSMYDLCNLLEEVTSVPAPRIFLPMWLAQSSVPFASIYYRISGQRPVFTKVALLALRSHNNVSHGKASQELGYNPRPFKETLTDALIWFIENNFLDESIINNRTNI